MAAAQPQLLSGLLERKEILERKLKELQMNQIRQRKFREKKRIRDEELSQQIEDSLSSAYEFSSSHEYSANASLASSPPVRDWTSTSTPTPAAESASLGALKSSSASASCFYKQQQQQHQMSTSSSSSGYIKFEVPQSVHSTVEQFLFTLPDTQQQDNNNNNDDTNRLVQQRQSRRKSADDDAADGQVDSQAEELPHEDGLCEQQALDVLSKLVSFNQERFGHFVATHADLFSTNPNALLKLCKLRQILRQENQSINTII
eukprot:TRINITY_DN14180_c0_g2_i1.p1 TRINITY_DN14180_c0_g2~~TRINITY_DN14180_c0_g2_i1.p1  ORF type:complete len:285 (-),score=71.92 TRINITY_DN14180_c0_g2_i1:12-791(-)